MIPTAKDRIAPGIYRVGGEVQVIIPELLEVLSIPDTPEHREEMVKVVKEAMIESGSISKDDEIRTVSSESEL